MAYRKKPVVVEAFCMASNQYGRKDRWPDWLHEAWHKNEDEEGAFYHKSGDFFIHTLEGEHKITMGDWIIQGVKGEIYPCKPDIFEATYEEMK